MPGAALRHGLPALLWIAAILIALALVAGLLLAATNTDPGRAFIVRQIEGLEPASGLRISIGRLDGAPLRDLTAHDLVLSDPKGPFLTIPELRVRWQPLRFIGNHLVLDRVVAPAATLARLPELLPSEEEEDQPLLPGFDISLGALRIGRLVVEPPVAGARYVLAAEGEAEIVDGRAEVRLDAAADAGDRLALRIDARPDDDVIDLDARLTSPAKGLAAALAGAPGPLNAQATAKGKLSAWSGRLVADVAGKPLARLDLVGAADAYRAEGEIVPAALYGPGTVARLTSPALRIEARAVPEEGGVAFDATARSAGLDLAARGRLDSERSRLEDVRVTGRLADPALLSDAARGPPVSLAATVSGPLAAPVIVAEARTPSLAFGETGLVNPRAGGSFVYRAGRLEGDISGRADRATGLGPELAEYAQPIIAEGRLAYGGGLVLIRPLVIRTDRVQTRGSFVYDIARETYLLALKGGVARYRYPGIGTFEVGLDLSVRSAATGAGYEIAGPFTARAVALESASARDYLGGLPVASGFLRRSPAGDTTVERLRLSAPLLSLAGDARLGADGALAANLSGRSETYGPVALSVAGTADRPRARLRATRPDLGLGLADLAVDIEPTVGGYILLARGDSAYGPLTADARLLIAKDGTGIDLRSARIAGLNFAGNLRPAGGAYQGTLAVSGRGIDGEIRLAPDAGDQRAAASLALRNARLEELAPGLIVGDGQLTGFVVLRDSGPIGQATLNAARISQGTLSLARLEASGSYGGDSGQLRLATSGRSGELPFSAAADARLVGDTVTLGASADLDGNEVRLAQPALITRDGGAWRLAPTTLIVEGGRAIVSGRYGDKNAADISLQTVNLARIGQLAGIDVSGTATGTARLTFPASGVPNGSIELLVRNFSRSGLATTSLPIDLEVAAALRDRAAAARGFIRREGAVLGAFQALATPIPGDAGEAFSERLLAAPLSGVVRLSAPAEAIWPLAGVESLDVRGPIGLSANLGGRVGEPIVQGRVRATGARLESAATGTVITDVRLAGIFSGPRLEIREFSGDAGSGRISGGGVVAYDAASGLTARLTGELAKAQLVRTDTARATISGPVSVSLNKGEGLIGGKLDINSASYTASNAAVETVPTLPVREIGLPSNGGTRREAAPAIVWRLAVTASAPNRLEVRGLGLDSEWEAALEVKGTAEAPRVYGQAELVRGTYDFAGRSFTLDRGRIRFQGENPPNPTLDIQATARVSDLTAVIRIAGTAERPEISFTSTPALPEDEVLSRLLFGTSVTDLSAPEAVQLAASLNTLRGGGGGGFNPINSVKKLTGLDRLRVMGEDETTGRGTAIAAGKYLARNVYLEVTSDAQGFTATQIEIALTRAISVLSTVQTVGGQKVSVRWSKDY